MALCFSDWEELFPVADGAVLEDPDSGSIFEVIEADPIGSKAEEAERS